MEQYIPKSALVAEIERRKHKLLDNIIFERDKEWVVRTAHQLNRIILFIDTLEVREEEEMYERPTIKIKDDISVISRLQYIDDDLKQIADFILEYASWNLHKDEYNQPVLEVPLFRVLDALIQRGKPYCEG